jgi:lysophospholipase L1-like esterase
MKAAWLLILTTVLCAQQKPAPASAQLLDQKAAETLATRMVQLMESTAFAVPGLIRASEPLKASTQATLGGMQRTPLNAALTYQFLTEIRAYLALSDSMPRPSLVPPTADQQFTELRDDLERMRRHFEAILQNQNQTAVTRNADPAELKRYAEANTKILPTGKTPRVVFLGDSITDAWRLNEYFSGRDFVNRGIAGQNTLQMLARFRQDVLGVNPKAVVILAGINDIGEGIALNQIEENLATMAELARARGVRVAFATVLPVSDYHKDVDPHNEVTKERPPANILALNKWIENYCRTEGLVYVNYFGVMVDVSGMMQADLSDDGLHPNSKGYRIMSPVALEAVTRLLDQPEDTQAKRRFRLLGK